MGIILLEGIGKQLNPDVNIFKTANPIIVERVKKFLRESMGA